MVKYPPNYQNLRCGEQRCLDYECSDDYILYNNTSKMLPNINAYSVIINDNESTLIF